MIKFIKSKLLYIIRYFFLLLGKTWNDFYAWMLDYQDRKLTLSDILIESRSSKTKYKGLWDWKQGNYFIYYLKKHGLKRGDIVFDLGFGYGRATIPLLKFQKGGAYIGSEISKKRITLAKEWIARENLKYKKYELHYTKDNTLSYIDDNSLDFVWIFSVFNHMPDNVLEVVLSALYKKIKSKGKIFATTLEPTSSVNSVKTFPREKSQIEGMFQKFNFKYKAMNDYGKKNILDDNKIYMLTK